MKFPYISNENPRADRNPDRVRTIKTSPNDDIIIEYCDEQREINACRFRTKADLTKLGVYYDKNLRTSEKILCYWDDKNVGCENYWLD